MALSDTLTALVQEAVDAAGWGEVRIDPVQPTRNPEHGEYQSNCAFRLSKVARMKPRDAAQKLAESMSEHPALERVEIAGPGFLNLHVAASALGAGLAEQCADEHLGVGQREGCVVIDYSSPNVAKRMHVGHLRSTVIGAALDRMHRFAGFEVVADNHIGDWGTQFGKLIVAWDAWLDEAGFEADPIGELERIYVKFAQDADDAMNAQARVETARLQAGDERNLGLWKRFIDVSMKEFEGLYDRMDIRFDVTYGESHYNDALQPLVDDILAKGVAEESKGAIVVPFTKKDGKGLGDTPLLIRKADGAALYGTTDLATVRFRLDEWAPVKMLYVTDTRQQLHFRQFFAASKKLGWVSDGMLEHVWFGLLSLPEGAMSSRKGNVIRLKDLLDEAVSRARAVVDHSSSHLPEEERAAIAEAVGIGAVRYADLSQNPQSNVTFEWDRMLAMDGNTAPFLMYSLARCRSIQRKGELSGEVAAFTPVEPLERELTKMLLKFPEVFDTALSSYRPNMLCDYLFQVAKALNRFYAEHRVLDAEGDTRVCRTSLVEATARTLEQGLGLLGIRALERM
ncbi:MAG: arginine--tRNA ligase [Proteobacteria bacterium]|nr:arginine--tRNA ligase [Pseudomonadota bacterium]MCP4921625.1 arginine--tRNA ligase [Pseudomonadota bacterium]